MWEQRPRAIRRRRPPRPCRHRRRRRTRGTASSTRGERVIKEAMASGLAAPRDPWLGPEPPDLACPAGMHRVRFAAMGTTVSVLLPERQVDAGSAAVRDLFVRWERTLSRFLPE